MKKFAALIGGVALAVLASPVVHAELIVAPNFPIDGVYAWHFAPDDRGAQLLAAFEKEMTS